MSQNELVLSHSAVVAIVDVVVESKSIDGGDSGGGGDKNEEKVRSSHTSILLSSLFMLACG